MPEEENKEESVFEPSNTFGTQPQQPEEEQDEQQSTFGDSGLLYGEKYDVPEKKEEFLDTTKTQIVDKKDLTDWDVIKALAKQLGTQIREPRKGCKKCYGRGWTARDSATKSPIPCNCIYPPRSPDEKAKEDMYDSNRLAAKPNRATRRNWHKNIQKAIKSGAIKLKKPDNHVKETKEIEHDDSLVLNPITSSDIVEEVKPIN